MKDIMIKCVKELVRVLLAAALAALGLETTGCVASGDGASAAFAVSHK